MSVHGVKVGAPPTSQEKDLQEDLYEPTGRNQRMRSSNVGSIETDITLWSATELATAIGDRRLSSREVLSAYLDRIDRRNPDFNAVVSLRDRNELLSEANTRDQQTANGTASGALHGIPMAVKDLALTAGILTTFGSPLFAEFVPKADCLMVERLRRAGCIVVGKTNVPEFGLGSHTFNPLFGATKNAYDRSRSAGGSSGGAAVALATSMLPIADGSDLMGSLRNPAAFNNVFGLRPSQGRVPTYPTVDAYVSQLATEGPMGRTVADVALLLSVQSGYDERAPLSLESNEDYSQESIQNFRPGGPLRVGWLGDLNGYLATEPGVIATCTEGLRRLEAVGAGIESTSFAMPPEQVWQSWLVWRRWLVGAGMAPHIEAGHRDLLKPEAQWEFDQSLGLTGHDVFVASQSRTDFYRSTVSLFDRFDVLALPSAQVFPFPIDQRWPSEINGAAMDTYHRWMEVVIYATFAGLPAISVPAGFGPTGLPMGLQLIGRPRGDLDLLRVAAAYEQTINDLGVGLA